MALSQKIAYYRERAGLSQQALGEKIGVSQVAICKWETGQNKPRITTVFRLADALGVNVSDLFDVSGTAESGSLFS